MKSMYEREMIALEHANGKWFTAYGNLKGYCSTGKYYETYKEASEIAEEHNKALKIIKREYYNKEFYSLYKDKKIIKEHIEYKVFIAGIHREFIKPKITEELIKKGLKVCKEEYKKFGRYDAAGANQGFVEGFFICTHWEEKEIIIMSEGDK